MCIVHIQQHSRQSFFWEVAAFERVLNKMLRICIKDFFIIFIQYAMCMNHRFLHQFCYINTCNKLYNFYDKCEGGLSTPGHPLLPTLLSTLIFRITQVSSFKFKWLFVIVIFLNNVLLVCAIKIQSAQPESTIKHVVYHVYVYLWKWIMYRAARAICNVYIMYL